MHKMALEVAGLVAEYDAARSELDFAIKEDLSIVQVLGIVYDGLTIDEEGWLAFGVDVDRAEWWRHVQNRVKEVTAAARRRYSLQGEGS